MAVGQPNGSNFDFAYDAVNVLRTPLFCRHRQHVQLASIATDTVTMAHISCDHGELDQTIVDLTFDGDLTLLEEQYIEEQATNRFDYAVLQDVQRPAPCVARPSVIPTATTKKPNNQRCTGRIGSTWKRPRNTLPSVHHAEAPEAPEPQNDAQPTITSVALRQNGEDEIASNVPAFGRPIALPRFGAGEIISLDETLADASSDSDRPMMEVSDSLSEIEAPDSDELDPRPPEQPTNAQFVAFAGSSRNQQDELAPLAALERAQALERSPVAEIRSPELDQSIFEAQATHLDCMHCDMHFKTIKQYDEHVHSSFHHVLTIFEAPDRTAELARHPPHPQPTARPNQANIFCAVCNHTYCRPWDYKRHLKTKKHATSLKLAAKRM